MKTIKIITIGLLTCFTSLLHAQQSQQKIEMKIDSIGNAKISMSMTMTAQQWQMWNGTLGNNPAALKREVERAMPGYFLEDFKLDKDDMNRSFVLNLKALGVCKINKNGKWNIETSQKNANITELTERKFMLVSSPPEYGGTLQQTYIIEFPKAAKNLKVDKDSFGQTVFQFEMDGPTGSSFNFMRIAGILFLVLGGGMAGKNLLTKKN